LPYMHGFTGIFDCCPLLCQSVDSSLDEIFLVFCPEFLLFTGLFGFWFLDTLRERGVSTPIKRVPVRNTPFVLIFSAVRPRRFWLLKTCTFVNFPFAFVCFVLLPVPGFFLITAFFPFPPFPKSALSDLFRYLIIQEFFFPGFDRKRPLRIFTYKTFPALPLCLDFPSPSPLTTAVD